MTAPMRKAAALGALLLLAAAPGMAARPAAPLTRASCNEACLKGLAASFVDALVSRNWQHGVPWADRVRYTENGVGMTVGDGIWATVTSHSAAPLVLADPASGSVVWLGSIDEHGQPSYLALRIRAEGNRIAEAEAVIRRKEGRPPFADPVTFVHDPAFAAGGSTRTARGRLIGLARGYLDSLGAKGLSARTRLSRDCVRTENGLVLTGISARAQLSTSCEGQIRAGLFQDVDRLRGVKFPVVDEARGIVVAVGTRDYSGRARTRTAPDGTSMPPDAPLPHSYAFVIAFKVQGGAITRIEETSSDVPYLMPVWRED